MFILLMSTPMQVIEQVVDILDGISDWPEAVVPSLIEVGMSC